MRRLTIAGFIAIAALVGSGCDRSDADADADAVPASDAGPTLSTPDSTPDSNTNSAAVVTKAPAAQPSDVPVTSGAPQGSTEAMYADQPIDPGLQPFIRTATADLAARLELDESEIETVSAVLVTWPDSSLGCPQPGMSYMQVLTDGSVIELGAAGRIYRYHSGGSRTPFLCDRPLNPRPPAVDTL
jgi:hypothetical protein